MAKIVDITGQRFGILTVLKRAENGPGGKAQWLCRCDCGDTIIATGTSLRGKNGRRSCGCLSFNDLSGKRFGMLKVIERAENVGEKVAWRCQCECGKEAVCTTANLKAGASTSCGCVRTKHHGKGTRLYRIWSGMKDRCSNPTSKYRKRYGGRGITVCNEWASDFGLFRDWALASGYQDGLTIDRIDNDGPYSPDNCQWLTRGENSKKARGTL